MKFRRRLAVLITAAAMLAAAYPASASAAELDYTPAASAGGTSLSLSDPGAPAPNPLERPTVKTAPKLKLQHNNNTIRVSWNKVPNAEKYYVYRLKDDGSYQRQLITKKTAFVVSNIEDGSERTYKVMAVKGKKGKSSTITCAPTKTQAFVLHSDVQAYSETNTPISGVTLRSGYYAGYVDTISYSDYYVLYVRNTRCLVKKTNVSPTGSNIRMLPCGSISQLDGSIYHGYACGPGAATILVASTLGIPLSVEQTISDAQRYGVTVYSDYTFLNDGMPLRGVKELVAAELKRNNSEKSVKYINSYSYSASKISSEIKKLIDRGCRVLVCLTESDRIENGRMAFYYTDGGVTHYAVITGYETYSDGSCDFYIGDSWYYEGDAYEYARDHGNRNRTTARYYYGLGKCSSGALGRSVKAAANVGSDFAGLVYIE